MHGIECCVSFAQNMHSTKMSAPLLPYIKKFAEDRSWRIRYMVADKIMELAKGLGTDQAKEHLLPVYAAMLKDAESEVRTAAVGKMSDFCKILDSDSILTKVVPSFADL
jgi:serine/threonine-protein phosphatase 2A regulatory subunit A